jgi:hypothetical protein
MRNRKFFAVGVALILLSVSPRLSAQQLASNTASVALSMNIGESVSVSATPGNISFNYSVANGSATASGPISVTTQWSLASTRSSLFTFAGFSSTTGLMGPGSTVIPTSDVFAAYDGGTANPCNGSSGMFPTGQACSAVPLFNAGSGLSGIFAGSHTDSILLSLSGLGAIPAGNYAGTLQIVAVAN